MSILKATLRSTFRSDIQRETGDSRSSQGLEKKRVMRQNNTVSVINEESFARVGLSNSQLITRGGSIQNHTVSIINEESFARVGLSNSQPIVSGNSSIVRQNHAASVVNEESFARVGISNSQSNARGGRGGHGGEAVVPCCVNDQICGPCLRLCSALNKTQRLSIEDAKEIFRTNGADARELSAVMCVDCRTVNEVQEGICTKCSSSNLFSVSCVGHQQFNGAVLAIRNDALGETNLFFPERDQESWHLVVQPRNPNRETKAKFDSLFELIRNGRRNARCILVNSDQVISKMVKHIRVEDYQRVTPNSCPSNMLAKAAWSLLRSQRSPLSVDIWEAALEYYLDRERIRTQRRVDVESGDVAFASMSNRIHEGASLSAYLSDLIRRFVSSCYDTPGPNRRQIHNVCRNFIPDLIYKMLSSATDDQVEGLVAESTLEEICEAVVGNTMFSCSLFHFIKRIWKFKLCLLIHPDRGGSNPDLIRCLDLFNLLTKFLVGENEQALDDYRRSVVVVSQATEIYQRQLAAIRSAPREYSQAALVGAREGSESFLSGQELVVFEEICTALVASGAISESLESTLHTLHKQIPEQVNELMQLVISVESCESGLSTTLAMMAIANGDSVELTRSEQSNVAIVHAMEEAPVIEMIEFPALGETQSSVIQAIDNLTSHELVVYQEFLAIRQAKLSANVIEEMDAEEEELDEVSEDYFEAACYAEDANENKNKKDAAKLKNAILIRQIRNLIYFNQNVSARDRQEMFKLVLGTLEFPQVSFVTTMEKKYLDSSVKNMHKMKDQVMSLVGREANKVKLNEYNLLKSQAGLKAKEDKRLLDVEKAESRESQVGPKPTCKSGSVLVCQTDVFGKYDNHHKAAKERASVKAAADRLNGLAWARDLKCDELGEITVTDMVTGFKSVIPSSLVIGIFSSAKEKDDDFKFTKGKHKINQVSPSCLLKKLRERDLPEEYYLRPLILVYNEDMSIRSIDAGTDSSASETIRQIRDRMENIDNSKKTDKHEDDIEEVDASLEPGKGEFIATFCAKRASKAGRLRESAERRQQASKAKTYLVITSQAQREFQYDDEVTGELVNDVMIETVQEIVKIVPTGSRNFYKLNVNENFGKTSKSRVRFSTCSCR